MANTKASEPQYRIRLEGEGLSLDQTVGRVTALAVVALVVDASATLLAGETVPFPAVLQTFVTSANPRSNAERITTITAYLTSHGQNPASRTAIRSAHLAAFGETPTNFSRDLAKAVSAGWVRRVKPDYYGLTAVGEDALKSRFGKN